MTVTHFQHSPVAISPPPAGHLRATVPTLDDYSFQNVWFHHSPRPLGASWASTATTTTTRPPPGGHVPSELISVTVTHFEHSPVAISPPPAGHRPAPPATLDDYSFQNVWFHHSPRPLGAS